MKEADKVCFIATISPVYCSFVAASKTSPARSTASDYPRCVLPLFHSVSALLMFGLSVSGWESW
jgi:hypothetical protein